MIAATVQRVLASPLIHTSTEFLQEPLGLETAIPRFSWYVDPKGSGNESLPRSSVQSTYRIQVSTASAALSEESTGIVWDSGEIYSNTSVLVPYSGEDPLKRNSMYFWRVGLTYNTTLDGSTWWSTAARFSIGADGASIADETTGARFIGAPNVSMGACPWFRKTFHLDANALASNDATVLGTVGSFGFHELWVNGVKANDDVLAPPVSDLAKRILLRTYDITALLVPGANNTVGLWLARGWTDFDSVNPSVKNIFNSTTTVSAIAVAQLTLTSAQHPDAVFLVESDGTWK